MDSLAGRIGALASSLAIRSPGCFSLLGATYGSSETEGEPALNSVLTEAARSLLERFLYLTIHCRQPAEQFSWAAPDESTLVQGFVSRLSRAHAGRGSWQPGWVIHSREPGGIIVEKDGLRLQVRPGQFRASRGRARRPGVHGSVRMPKEYREMFSGFYMALGDRDNNGDGDIVRLYWHLTSGGAEPFLAHLTRGLNRARVSFRLKLLANPLGYVRSDAAVLYLWRQDFERAHPVVRRTYDYVQRFLRSPVSLYAKRLAPGLGLAEQPPDHSSFGENRSRLLAEALASETMAREQTADGRTRAVVQWLGRAGVSMAAPHLNVGSVAKYEALAGA